MGTTDRGWEGGMKGWEVQRWDGNDGDRMGILEKWMEMKDKGVEIVRK